MWTYTRWRITAAAPAVREPATAADAPSDAATGARSARAGAAQEAVVLAVGAEEGLYAGGGHAVGVSLAVAVGIVIGEGAGHVQQLSHGGGHLKAQLLQPVGADLPGPQRAAQGI